MSAKKETSQRTAFLIKELQSVGLSTQHEKMVGKGVENV